MSYLEDLNTDRLKVWYGDCLDLLQELPDNSVQLIVTSPPYSLGKPYESRTPFHLYLVQQERVIIECQRVLKVNGSICWQVGNHILQETAYLNNNLLSKDTILPLDIALFHLFVKNYFRLRNRIVWQFGHGLHCTKRFSGRYETIMWFTKSDDYVFNLDSVRVPQKYPGKKSSRGPNKGELSGNPLGKNPGDVWEMTNVKQSHPEKTGHPCQFPVELVERLILALTNPEDTVLDPFVGSGTTLIAALLNDRKVIAAEIYEPYIKIIRERLDAGKSGRLHIKPSAKVVANALQVGQRLTNQTIRLKF